jgi:hypothetical protein
MLDEVFMMLQDPIEQAFSYSKQSLAVRCFYSGLFLQYTTSIVSCKMCNMKYLILFTYLLVLMNFAAFSQKKANKEAWVQLFNRAIKPSKDRRQGE